MLRKLLITLCLGAFIIVAMGAGCKKTEEEKPADNGGDNGGENGGDDGE
jgi:hypothetical protein